LLAELPNTIQSCSWHGMVTASLTLEQSGYSF